MKTRSIYTIRCLATGIVILTLFAVAMFWLRRVCVSTQSDWSDAGREDFEPTLLLSSIMPNEIQADPNIAKQSRLVIGFQRENIQAIRSAAFPPASLSGLRGGLNADVYAWDPPRKGWPGAWLYFDRKLGLIIYYARVSTFDPNARGDAVTQRYAGPEGIGLTPEKSLGRFESPVVSPFLPRWDTCVYDTKLRRFFRLDWRGKQVTMGPQLVKKDAHRPLQLGLFLGKSEGCLYMHTENVMRQVGTKANEEPNLVPVANVRAWGGSDTPVFVLDASGRIDMLDPQTLTITGVAGRLPDIGGPFGSTERSVVQGLFAYEVMPLWLWSATKEPRDSKPLRYLGCAVAALGRDATHYSIQLFNDKGSPVTARSGAIVNRDSGFGTTKYLLENLHPPVLSMLSEITAPYIEATAGAHGLFILPNSFIADRGRVLDEKWAIRFAAGLGLISPSLVMVAILAWFVGRDARFFGFSKNTRTLWMLSTVVFGIPACITYLLMRPRTVMVTCKNCGRLRRPDMERCQHCKSPWDVPELIPPAWRVLDGAVKSEETEIQEFLPASEQNTDSSVNNL